jgi:SAM-dependent methyltransferase
MDSSTRHGEQPAEVIQGHSGIRDAYRDEKVARDYIQERFRRPLGSLLHDRQLGAIRRVIDSQQPKRVLEIAPGPARLTMDVARILPTSGVAVDASLQMLKEAAPRVRSVTVRPWLLMQGDAFRLPLAGPFDFVYTFRLIRHFERADRIRLYQEVARVLRPGGVLVFDAINEEVSAPLRAALPPELRHYDALLTPATLREELEAAGFGAIELTGVQHRYPLLFKLDILLSPRSRMLSRLALELVDRAPGGKPLEWVVTCRRG